MLVRFIRFQQLNNMSVINCTLRREMRNSISRDGRKQIFSWTQNEFKLQVPPDQSQQELSSCPPRMYHQASFVSRLLLLPRPHLPFKPRQILKFTSPIQKQRRENKTNNCIPIHEAYPKKILIWRPCHLPFKPPPILKRTRNPRGKEERNKQTRRSHKYANKEKEKI